MLRCCVGTFHVLLISVLSLSQTSCALFLSLDEFEESLDGGALDGGIEADAESDADDPFDGGACSLSIDPVAHNFGPVPVGSVSASVQLEVVNNLYDAVGPLTIFAGSPPSPYFTMLGQTCEGTTLARGSSCTVEFVFSAEFPGKYSTSVVIRAAAHDCAIAFLEGGAPPG